MKIFDTHTHFDIIREHIQEKDQDLRKESELHCYRDIWRRAQNTGLSKAVHIGIDLESSRHAMEIASSTPSFPGEIYYSIGYHPSHDMSQKEEIQGVHDFAREKSKDPLFRAIGEVGLDYYWIEDKAERERQRLIFRSFIDLALELDKTLVIHCRDGKDEEENALEDTWKILDSYAEMPKTIMHCFSGDASYAKRFQELGCYISFAGNVTFKNAAELREALSVTSKDRLLIETDAPYLTPMPHRGKRNEPAYLPFTLKFISDYLKEDEQKLAATIYANSLKAFSINTEDKADKQTEMK